MLSRKAMLAAQFPQSRIEPLPMVHPTACDDYPGVIVTEGDFRLAVSPHGRAYLPQVRRGGAWHCGRPLLSAGDLAFYCKVIDGPWPEKILAVLPQLPSDPADWSAGWLAGKGAGG